MRVATAKLRKGAFCALVVASAFGILASGAAAKKVTVGQLFAPTESCSGPDTLLVTGVASGNSYVVPKAGVITSWSWYAGGTPVPGLKLKVGRSVGRGKYKVVGQATAGSQTPNTITRYTAHIHVKAGDLIGTYENGGNCESHTTSSLDSFGYASGDVLPGMTRTFTTGIFERIPVSVRVNLDCVVPNLKGKTLTAAKRALKAASCTLGTVRPTGQTRGKVKRQSPAAGKVLAPEAKVNVTLG